MDPLSITSGIIAVLQVTKEVISYLKETKDAPKELTKVYEEAKNLVILLYELKDLIAGQDSHDPWLRTTTGLTARNGSLDQYKKALEILVPKITGRGLRKVGQVFTWKFNKDEVMALLSQIERIKSLVQIALGLDHMFVTKSFQQSPLSHADCHSTLSRAIKEDLQSIQTGIADLKVDTSTIVDATSEIKSDTTALRDDNAVRHKHDLMRWICPVDYHVQHQDFIDRHQTGTGQWFLEDAKFQGWDQSKDATLFCPGIPGAGKTIMAALVINYLLRTQHVANEPVTFIYCNYKRQSEQSAKHMLSSILRQIVDIQPGILKLVQDFNTSHTTKRTTPSSDESRQILGAVSRGLHRLTIVVDALDECETRARQEFLSAVETLRGQCKVRILATSRFLPAIESHSTFSDKPKLEVRASDEDLEMYIRSRASELNQVVSKPDLLENLVSSTVIAVGGMYVDRFPDESQKRITDNCHTRFLLAQLLMDSFRDKLTVRDVKFALRNLPQGSDAYDIAYHDAMERIFAQGKGSSEMAKKILAWILCACCPLSTLELLHALAVEPGDVKIDEDNILETKQLLTICAGLVTIDEQSNNVRFIHYTTQEYLQRNQGTWLPDAKIEVASSCIAYLSIDGLAIGPCLSQVDYEYRLREFVLLEYAAVY
jgi:hypothetical protein